MRTILGVLALSIAVHAQTAPISVYVFTRSDPSGLVDEDSKARASAVEGLTKTLSKSKVVQPVSSAAEATVQIEITKTETAEETDHLSALNNALNGAHNSDTKKVTYRLATLRAGEYSTELRGRANVKNEAGLARAIESWVKENAARLVQKSQ